VSTPLPDNYRRRKNQAVAAAFGVNLVLGILLVMQYPGLGDPAAAETIVEQIRVSPLNLLYQAAMLLICFTWLHFDSRQLDIRRPWWLNIGIALLTSVFVPYYLYKTRPEGRRGAAILAFFGIVFGCIVSMMLGMTLAFSLHGGPAGSAPAA
jgi:hypothetical protein